MIGVGCAALNPPTTQTPLWPPSLLAAVSKTLPVVSPPLRLNSIRWPLLARLVAQNSPPSGAKAKACQLLLAPSAPLMKGGPTNPVLPVVVIWLTSPPMATRNPLNPAFMLGVSTRRPNSVVVSSAAVPVSCVLPRFDGAPAGTLASNADPESPVERICNCWPLKYVPTLKPLIVTVVPAVKLLVA